MTNRLLSQNKGKKGSYTIKVRENFAVPDKSIKSILKDIELFKQEFKSPPNNKEEQPGALQKECEA